MKIRGTKKNKISKRKQKLTKRVNLSGGMGLKALKQMMEKSTDPAEIARVVGEFTDLRTITGTFVVGYELEFDLLSFIIYRGYQRQLLKTDRILFGFDKIFLSGDYMQKNKLGLELNSLIHSRAHSYLYAPLMNPELIYLTVDPYRFRLDIYKMYYIMFYKLLLGTIIYLDDDIIAIDISHSEEPHVIIVIPNTRKQMMIEDQAQLEPIFDVTKSKIQCTVDIPIQYYVRILDIFIILLLPDKDNTGKKDDIIESNTRLQLILWCKENCNGDQFAGLILYYYLCYLKYHFIKEKDPHTTKYTKGNISFAFRHNPIEMLEIIVRMFENNNTTVVNYRRQVTVFILGDNITDKIFTEDVPSSFIDAGGDRIDRTTTGMTIITQIFDNFTTGLGIAQVDIVKDSVASFKLEFRSFSRDDTVVKISKIFDLSKFKFDEKILMIGKQVVDVLTIDCLQKLIDPKSRMLTNTRFDVPDVDNVVHKIHKILDTANKNVLYVSKSVPKKLISDKLKRMDIFTQRRRGKNLSAPPVPPALSATPLIRPNTRNTKKHNPKSSGRTGRALSVPPVPLAFPVPPALSAPPLPPDLSATPLIRPNTRRRNTTKSNPKTSGRTGRTGF